MVALISNTRKAKRLEDLQCLKHEADLRHKLLQSVNDERRRRQIAEAAKIDDPEMIDRLIKSGFTAETVSAILLAPIAMVAWGSGYVTAQERDAAVGALQETEFGQDEAVMNVFANWLESRPASSLMSLWSDFIRQRMRHEPADTSEQHRQWMMRLLNEVAIASGGLLGYGAICSGERAVLETIDQTFGELAID